MTPRFSSDRKHGLFVSVDGPGGAGKTTIVRHLAQMLVAHGAHVHVTAEPSTKTIGQLAYELTPTVTGHALACLYAADRYHHVETEIRPLLRAGNIVISDRYLASGQVVQRFDGVDPVFLWQLNEEVERPDLTVILEADPNVITERLSERGPHNRFQLAPDSSHAEVKFYREATDTLIEAGFDVMRVDCSSRPPEQSAALIRNRLTALLAPNEVLS
ncbi:dTMP kinase [Amycolatopsis sp. NPDC051071]|uniref:dTMP kinase n=1 Tax=Amycolatopsis sp. NPDC051071 TaxID=3154637 RepID=UPI00343564E0